ncbi:DUF4893 domain-containing protein [Maritalea sp.]|uniref:DUF4893 domain-containing protein n=1 Tax=Maritalea sp. TaxID=2003361 RepID=UPI003EF908AB
MIKAKIALAAIFVLSTTSTILGQECGTDGLGLSVRDVTRLEHISHTRMLGLSAALVGEQKSERAMVSSLYSTGIEVPKLVQPGNYKCRTIKLGGNISALVSYSFFDCRISADGEQLKLEKLTGSQRFTGELFVQKDGIAYKGAGHYGYEQPNQYVGDSDRDQVGCLVQSVGKPESLILELPKPFFESVFDVIELVRRY